MNKVDYLRMEFNLFITSTFPRIPHGNRGNYQSFYQYISNHQTYAYVCACESDLGTSIDTYKIIMVIKYSVVRSALFPYYMTIKKFFYFIVSNSLKKSFMT